MNPYSTPFRLTSAIKSLITRMERIAESKVPELDSAGITSLSYGEFEILCQQHGISPEDRKLNQALSHRDWLVTSQGLTYFGALDITTVQKHHYLAA